MKSRGEVAQEEESELKFSYFRVFLHTVVSCFLLIHIHTNTVHEHNTFIRFFSVKFSQFAVILDQLNDLVLIGSYYSF